MEDLLRKYRRAARLNDWAECLRCLRQMVSVSDEGIEWQRDLDELEAQAMDGIRDHLPAWIEAGNTAAMEQALVELAACSDAARRRMLMADVSKALDTCYRELMLNRGSALLSEARAAYEVRDRQRLIHAIRQYQKLNENVYFNPTAAMSGQFSESYEWYKVAVRDEEQKRHFDTTLTELLVELGKENPGYNLVQVWRRLKACGEELSPELSEKAQKAVRKIERNRRAMRKMAVMGAAVVGVVLGTGISSLIVQWQRQETQDLVLKQLDQQWEASSPEQYIALMETISRQHAYLIKRETMQNRAKRIEDFESLLRNRQAAFDQRLRAFQEVLGASANWDTEELLKRRNEVERLAQDAAEAFHALGPAINSARMRASIDNWGSHVPAEWKSAAKSLLAWVESPRLGKAELDRSMEQWEQFKAERQGRIDLAFTALIEQADVTLSSVDAQTADEDALIAPRQLLEKAARMQGVSSNLFERLDSVNKRVDAMGSEILRRRQLFHDMEVADSLPAYLAAILNYRDAFPQHQVSILMSNVLAHAEFYKSVLTPAVATNIPDLYKPRTEYAAWETLRLKTWPEIRAKLMSLSGEKRLVDLRTFSLGRWQNGRFLEIPGFLEGEFSAGSYDKRKGAVVTGIHPVIEGKTYFPGGNDIEPDFQFTTFNRAQGAYVGKASLMPHCQFVDGLLGVARTDPGQDFIPDVFLAQSAETLAQRQDIPPLLRLRLIQFIVEQLTPLAPEGGKGMWNDFMGTSARIGNEINWLCTENREVMVANTHADEMLRRYFTDEGLTRRYLYYVTSLKEAAGWAPVWAGYADWAEKNPQPVVKSRIMARELWVFRPQVKEGIWQVAALQDGSSWRLLVPLVAGEPLYAPNDSSTSCEKLKRLRQDAQVSDKISLPAQSGWPKVKCTD
jgi:hypothetical protein